MIKDKILARLSEEERAQFDSALDHHKSQILQRHTTDEDRHGMAHELQQELRIQQVRQIMRETKFDYDCAVAGGHAGAIVLTKQRLHNAVAQFYAVLPKE